MHERPLFMSATTGVPGELAVGSRGWATYSPTLFRGQPGPPARAAFARDGVEINRPAGLNLSRLRGV